MISSKQNKIENSDEGINKNDYSSVKKNNNRIVIKNGLNGTIAYYSNTEQTCEVKVQLND